MAITYYRQCTLKRVEGNSTFTYTCWLPDKYCKIGGSVQLKDSDGKWKPQNWTVVGYGQSKKTEKQLPDPHSTYKAHRKRTGDALPKK